MVSGIIKVEEVLLAEPKAEADNANQDLDYSGYHRKKTNLIIVLLYIVLKKNKDKQSIAWNTAVDISL